MNTTRDKMRYSKIKVHFIPIFVVINLVDTSIFVLDTVIKFKRLLNNLKRDIFYKKGYDIFFKIYLLLFKFGNKSNINVKISVLRCCDFLIFSVRWTETTLLNKNILWLLHIDDVYAWHYQYACLMFHKYVLIEKRNLESNLAVT